MSFGCPYLDCFCHCHYHLLLVISKIEMERGKVHSFDTARCYLQLLFIAFVWSFFKQNLLHFAIFVSCFFFSFFSFHVCHFHAVCTQFTKCDEFGKYEFHPRMDRTWKIRWNCLTLFTRFKYFLLFVGSFDGGRFFYHFISVGVFSGKQ